MGMITVAAMNQAAVASAVKTGNQKPVWNGKKAYTYLEEMNTAGVRYGKEAAAYYSSLIGRRGEEGAITKEELMTQLKELFPEYTLTNSEPKDVRQGKHMLYIDENNLKRMQEDSDYRAKVYGLLDRELTIGKEFTLTYSDGRKVNSHITGSFFSLSDSNRKYAGEDGIPYRGGCSTDHPFSSSDSRPQMRSMSFANEVMNVGERSTSKTGIAGLYEEQIKKRKAKLKEEKKKEEKRVEQREEEKRLEQKEKEKHLEQKEEEKRQETLDAQEKLLSQSQYRSVSDVQWAYKTGSSALKHLQEGLAAQYETYAKGMVRISKSFLRACLSDEEKMGKLHEMLSSVQSMYEDAKRGGIKGFQGMTAKINAEGELETETYGGSVAVNETKRLAQIANAQTPADIKMVMNLLAKDMDDCKRGLRQGMCDEEEVRKVERLMEKAQKRQLEIDAAGAFGIDESQLTINILM